MSILQKIMSFLFKEVIDGSKITINGLADHVSDIRDFRYSMLGGVGTYVPKHERLELPVLEIKNQAPNNTCVFHSFAACQEVSAQVPLSPRSMVLYAKNKGYLRADGISTIRQGQQVGKEFGVSEESVLSNDNLPWSSYSSVPIDSAIAVSADKHKSKSYFWVKTKGDYLKALDDGYAIHTGFDWYSSYNQSAGFSPPWILPWRKGARVGGHAVKCMGYDTKTNVLIFQNSFGVNWGDNGKFYIRMDDFFREGIEGAVAVTLDETSIAAFIAAHEGKDIKSIDNPCIYRVENGKKRAFPDESTYYLFGGHFDDGQTASFDVVANTVVDMIPDGNPMSAEQSTNWLKVSDYWAQIRWLKHPENIEAIENLLSQ